MSIKAIIARLKPKPTVTIYIVEIEVEFDLESAKRRFQIIPESVAASSEDEAKEIALAIERGRHHEMKRVGDPRVIAVRKVAEFREGW